MRPRLLTGSLQKKIDKLYEQQLIREYVRDAAHEIRFGGNEVAHGDLVHEPMDHGTATEILGLMDEMLDEVFQSPARVERHRHARLEREVRRNAAQVSAPATGGWEITNRPARRRVATRASLLSDPGPDSPAIRYRWGRRRPFGLPAR